MNNSKHLLRKLGVYGFDHLELVILASLVSEDPLLLIGKAGTGKTYLLNSISEALNLDHRFYNASFLSFDDLVGFPFPNSDGETVSFLKTLATIWGAESVLIDEINRCKPEIQNKFFSIIQEKKIQGITLEKLKYRWAAMNPLLSESSDSNDFYEGTFALDQALADRFAFIIEVPDWNELSKEEQELVIHPAGEGAVSERSFELMRLIDVVKPKFEKRILQPSVEVVMYCRIISTLLGEAGYRISPRRARLLARNFSALFLVAEEFGFAGSDKDKNSLYKLGLKWSLPHRAWKGKIPDLVIDSAHAECMRLVNESKPHARWLSEFLIVPSLTTKIDMLFDNKIEKEVKSLGILQFIKRDSAIRAGIFAFAVQPFLGSFDVIDEEALNELTKLAIKIMKVEGEIDWREGYYQNGTKHPDLSACMHYLDSIPDTDKMRKKRAKQFYYYLITNDIPITDPEFIETELNCCFNFIRQFISAESN